MADGLTTAARRGSSSGTRWRARYRLVPWWVRITVVYVVARLLTGAMMGVYAGMQTANSFTGQHPRYLAFASIWDGAWYRVIATGGYPSTLPVDAAGHVTENAWAFMPAYPLAIRALMELTGAGFAPLAVVVSVAFGAGTALLLHRLLRTVLPEGSATFGVVLFCVAPVSPLLQLGYAEAMFSFFLCLSLLLLVRRRYVAMLPVVLVLSFTRPGALPLALAIGVHALLRLRRRDSEPFPLRERVAAAVATVTTGLLGLAWPVVAGVATGAPRAYEETELAWRSAYIGRQSFVPFTPWVQGANWWLPGGLGLVVLAVAVLALAGLLLSPWGRRLGVDLRLWSAAYALYLLAVWFPQSSTFRILLPLFPLLGALAVPRWRPWRLLLVAASLLGQWVWIDWCWWVDGADWTPP